MGYGGWKVDSGGRNRRSAQSLLTSLPVLWHIPPLKPGNRPPASPLRASLLRSDKDVPVRRSLWFCLFVLSLTGLAQADSSLFEMALVEPEESFYRAQSPAPLVQAPPAGGQYYPGTMGVQPGMEQFVNPSQPGYPGVIQDPFMQGQPQPMISRGLNGPQPKRFGWTHRKDVWYIPSADAEAPATGDMSVLGVDMEMRHVKPIMWGWCWSLAPQFNYRSISGPVGTATTDLPENAYRFGLDMSLQSAVINGFSIEAGFTPSVGTDFEKSIHSDAYMFDGRLIAHWRWNPQLMWTLGVTYWDRVDEIILPYGGLTWTPNDLWEFRLIFPEPRISVFVGAPWGVPTWLYVRGEYHVEAYEMNPSQLAGQTRVQFSDYRVAGGLRWETGYVTTFVEAGYVFNREVDYDRFGTDYGVDSGFMGRIGLRY